MNSHPRLTLATWNVEWLFDGVDDPPMAKRRDSREAAVRIGEVAGVLSSIDADIVLLAEVESCEVISRVANQTGDASYEPYLVRGTDSALGQQVALLSRLQPARRLSRTATRSAFPAEGSSCGKEARNGSTGVSKHLIARFFPMPGHELVIIGLHLKARPTDTQACHQREGQARIVRHLVREALQNGSHVVVLGDLNDFDPDVPDASGQAPSSGVLRTIKDVDGDGVADLWNVLEAVPLQQRWTNWWDRNGNGIYDGEGEQSLLDHILVSNSLRPLVEAVGVEHGHDPARLSDHWPLWVRFDLTSWTRRAEL